MDEWIGRTRLIDDIVDTLFEVHVEEEVCPVGTNAKESDKESLTDLVPGNIKLLRCRIHVETFAQRHLEIDIVPRRLGELLDDLRPQSIRVRDHVMSYPTSTGLG